MKDYYKILGITESATADEIKSAFRKLAVKYHPDKNPGKAAEDTFKEANQAYEVLGDSQKRQEYDNQRRFGGSAGASFGPGNFQFHNNFNGDVNDIFSSIFNQGGFSPFQRPVRNQDTHVQLDISLEDVLSGRSIPVQFTDSSGKHVNITVNVPAGIEHGTRLRYAGNGSRINPSLPPGDLIIVITVQPHPQFERSGPHLVYNAEISLWECLLGCQKIVPGIDSTSVNVTVPPLCQDQTFLKVAGKGLPVKNGSKQRGDLMVRVNVKWPSSLTQQQQDVLKTWTAVD